MARTDAERFDEAIAYIKKMPGGGPELAQEIIDATGARKNAFGARMSLKKSGIALIGTGEQHTAVRAVVLCELAFFSFPYAPAVDHTNTPTVEISDAEITDTKKKLLPKFRGTVDDEIKEYMLGADRTLVNLMAAARRVREPAVTPIPIYRAKRSDNFVGGGGSIVCYDGVKNWLFASGMASRRWLKKKGTLLNANTTGDIFGAGNVVPPAQWGQIEPGYFWSIERRIGAVIDATTCHWGVSLGNGEAVATNNTTASLGGPTGVVQLAFLEKEGDGTKYGIYRFTELCDVLNRNIKYGHHGAADPAAVDTNIQVKKYNPLLLGGDKLF